MWSAGLCRSRRSCFVTFVTMAKLPSLIIWFIFIFIHGSTQLRNVTVPVAGLFDKSSDEQLKKIFQYAVHRVSRDPTFAGVQLESRTDYIDDIADSFLAEKKACNQTQHGVGAIFGPQTVTNTAIVKSVCETMEVPCVMANWDLAIDKGLQLSLNLYPEPRILSQGLAAIIKTLMGWKTFTVIYDKEESLMHLQDVLKLFKPSEATTPIGIYKMDEDDDHGPLLKRVKASGESHIVVHCEPHRVLSFLRQAQEVKMMQEYQSYFITNLDAHTLDFEDFRKSGTNITCVRIIDTQSDYVQSVFEDWGHLAGDISPGTIRADAAFIFDAVHVYARALHLLKNINNVRVDELFCDRAHTWRHGSTLARSMRKLENNGLSGVSRFDEEGNRVMFTLEILIVARTGELFTKLGTWDPENGVQYVVNMEQFKKDKKAEQISNKVFIVSSRTGAPHLMRKNPNDTSGTSGNELFEGYAMDLIDAISKEVPFQYRFELAPGNGYGRFDSSTGRWDGIMGQIIEHKADLAICDFTITQERERLLDFSIPFMTLGISIIFMKPVKEDPELYSFLSPFSVEVWMYMATAYLGVSLILFILARAAPDEWDNPHPCVDEYEELENTFNLCNCLWFSMGSILGQGCDLLPKISPYEWAKPHPCNDEAAEMETSMNLHNSIWHNCGSLMQQGSDIAPKAMSTRIVAGMWWFFTLIIISSYTANLTAFLTKDLMKIEIRSAEDLAKQQRIIYGTVLEASTYKFFKNSNHSTYQRMWAAMESTRPSVFTVDNDEGVYRVLNGKRTYAFIMESTSIEYQVERHCDLQQIGGLLDSKGYGIAMPANSPYRSDINEAILKMQEDGRLAALKEKWWTQMYGGGACKDENEDEDTNDQELGLQNVGGVFVVLALGCFAGFMMSILEFLWNIRKIAVEEEITPKEALIREIKFAMSCGETTKPVPKKKSSSKSSGSGSSRSVDSHPDNFVLTTEH